METLATKRGSTLYSTGYRPYFASKSLLNIIKKNGLIGEYGGLNKSKNTNSYYLCSEICEIRVSDHTKFIENFADVSSQKSHINVDGGFLQADVVDGASFQKCKESLEQLAKKNNEKKSKKSLENGKTFNELIKVIEKKEGNTMAHKMAAEKYLFKNANILKLENKYGWSVACEQLANGNELPKDYNGLITGDVFDIDDIKNWRKLGKIKELKSYLKKEMCKMQIYAIYCGFKAGIDISKYDNKKNHFMQMETILNKLIAEKKTA